MVVPATTMSIFLGLQPRQHADPGQIDPFHLDPHVFGDEVEQVDVEADRLVALKEFERRELEFGADSDHATLLDIGERILRRRVARRASDKAAEVSSAATATGRHDM